MELRPETYHAMKSVSTWLKYIGMAFSTYLSIYELTRKTANDDSKGADKRLTPYGRHYRSLLIGSLLFTIGISVLENFADKKIDDEKETKFRQEVDKAVSTRIAEFRTFLLPVLEQQRTAIDDNLKKLNADFSSTNAQLQQDIAQTSAHAQESILRTTAIDNQLLEHRLRDLAQANEKIRNFEIQLTPVDAHPGLLPSEVGPYLDIKNKLTAITEEVCSKYRNQYGPMCDLYQASLRSWDDYGVAGLFYYFDRSHLTVEVNFTLNNAGIKIGSAMISGHPEVFVPIVQWSGGTNRLASWPGELSARREAPYSIKVRTVSDGLFKTQEWHGADINASTFSISVCDPDKKEPEEVRKRHLLASPVFGRWQLEIKGQTEDTFRPLIKTYDAEIAGSPSLVGSCRNATYIMY